MPCAGLQRRYKARKNKRANMALANTDAFYKAAKEYAKLKKWGSVRSVSMISPKILWVLCRPGDRYSYSYGTTASHKVTIDALHDMAAKYETPHNPDEPMTMAELFDHFHVKPPKEKDLLAKAPPIPETIRRWKRVEGKEGDFFVEEAVIIEPKKAEAIPNKKKKTTKKIVMVMEED